MDLKWSSGLDDSQCSMTALSSIYIDGVRERELKPTSAYICWRQLSRDLWNFFNLNVQRLRYNALCLPFVLLLDLIQLVYPKKDHPGVGNLVAYT